MFSLRQRIRTRSTLVFAMLGIGLALSVPGAPARAQIVINELLAAPASDWNGDGEVDYKNDEWVEILNTSTAAADLTGLYLKDATGDAYHYGFSGVLGPGEVMLVTGSDAVAWQAEHGAGSTGLSLNNGGDTLELWRDVEFPRVFSVVDMVPIPAHAAGSDRALGRLAESLEWVVFDALNPYGGELEPPPTGCTPSPGAVNTCDVVGVEDASMGLLKARHATTP